MQLACIADDFTGASDLANTLTREGMRTLLAVGVPPADSALDAEAVVVALKTRSIAPSEAVAQSLAAYAWLRKRGADQFLFKICSTFDSRFATGVAKDARGNIGPVGEALRLALGSTDCVPVCPAFPANGRTVYRGHLFVGDALLSESGMAQHPITPMTDANLVRVLQAQCETRVGRVPLEVVAAGPDALAGELRSLAQQGVAFAIVDAIGDDHLRTIGRASAQAPLLIGGSGIAIGLPANFAVAGVPMADAAFAARVDGPIILLAGSCSTATRAQVAAYGASGPVRRVDPARIEAPGYVDELADWCLAQAQAQAPLVTSTAAPDEVAAAQARHGADLPGRIERFFAALAARLQERGVRRFIVGGGETSGAVVAALGLDAMHVGAQIDPGVPALFAPHPRGGLHALALKSGNFGAEDFFTRAQARV